MQTPWRTMREAAEYLRFKTPDNARRFLIDKRVPLKKRGHSLLVHIDDLDASMQDVHQPKEAR